MKLHLLDRSTKLNNASFSVRNNRYPNFLKIWHYHPELELVFIKKSTGTRFIGDSIEKFEEGEVVLIGESGEGGLTPDWLRSRRTDRTFPDLPAQPSMCPYQWSF